MPPVRVKTPPAVSVMLLFIVTPFVLFMVRLVRFVTFEGIETPAEEPPKDKLDAATVTKFKGVPAMVGPFSESVNAPTAKVPAVKVRVPFKDNPAPSIIFLLVVKLFNPPVTVFKVITAPVPVVRLEVTPPVSEPPP